MDHAPTILTPTVRASLQAALFDEPVDAAYLFGSQVSGTTHSGSNVDVAILPSDRLSTDDRFELRLRLMSSLASAFDVNDVDVVDLVDHGASTLIRFNAIQPNFVIFDRNPERRKQFEFETMRDYFDQYHAEQLMANRLLQRLAARTMP